MAANGRCQIDIHIDINERKKCIFRVPKVLRRQNAKAYTPDIVSIGPFHFQAKKVKQRRKGFRLMQRVKERYREEFLAGMGLSKEELTTKLILRSGQQDAEGFKEQACHFYAESFKQDAEGLEEQACRFCAESIKHISATDFTEMMIVDGCFLIQFFEKLNNPNLRLIDDPVFNMDCMRHFLFHDILLLENQLPWFVIRSLYGLILDIYPDKASLSDVILTALRKLPSLKHCSAYEEHHCTHKCHCDTDVLHILDLVRTSIVTPSLELAARERAAKKQTEEPYEASVLQNHSATALSNADIKCKVNKDKKSIIDIDFKKGWLKNGGTLWIPKLTVGMSSETLFRNLIALEQCYHGYQNIITSYAIFMDNLISSKEDLDLLCKEKVICNLLSEENGCKFFSNLYKDIPHTEFYYVDLCEKVNHRYKQRRYTWLAALKFDKFSNPWKVLAFVIGSFVLVLTAWNQANNTIMKLNK